MRTRPMPSVRTIVQTSLLLAIHPAAADPGDPAEFTVTPDAVWTDIEPVGVNLTSISGGTNFVSNNFIRGSGMEPAIARYLVRIERSGPGWIEWDQSVGGISMWDQNATGFGDGATVRLYRIVDAQGRPLSYAGGTRLEDNTGADRVVFLGETSVPPGGWVAEPDGGPRRVSLADAGLELAYGDHAVITVTKTRITREEIHPRLHQWFQPHVSVLSNVSGSPNIEMNLVPHRGPIPPAFTEPGETCLRVGTTSGDWVAVGQWLFHGLDEGEGQWYSQLEPGASYRAQVWLRQDGIADGRVRFMGMQAYDSIGQPTPWTVTGEWRRYTFDFTGPAYPDASRSHGGFGLEFSGPGSLDIDNFVVFRNDAEHGNRPFTPHRLSFDELMAAMPSSGPRPAIRFFTDTYYEHSTIDRLLSTYPSGTFDFIHNVGAGRQHMTIPLCLEWALATGDSPETRCPPNIALSEEFTEGDWLAVAEYLGVPYDPAVDTPASKPWAFRRFTQRGTGTPWTEEFREIILEFGNETWHAGVFGGWDGFGRPGWVTQGGREYGLFANYFLMQRVMQQPWWAEHRLGDKIRFHLNAFYDGASTAYGGQAIQAAPAARYLGHANYVGPTWETGETPFARFDDEGMQETLVGAVTGMFPLIEQVDQTRALLVSQGLADYRPVAYEGGPSGYYLPGNGTPEQVRISQLYGKSLGMGVAALDAWMYSTLHGYRHQFLFGFAAGNNWTSHTMPRAGGFRQHSGWLALRLRNLAIGGEILRVTRQAVPTYVRAGEPIPLTAVYATRSRDRLNVFVLSRTLDGAHDGRDFGDGVTPVTINLPITGASRITRHAMTAPDGSFADPRASNLEGTNIAITSMDVDPAVIASGRLVINTASGGAAGGMPPGTALLYVIELEDAACAADINGDGNLDIFDLLGFFAALAAGADGTDLNGDGASDILDLLAYVDRYATGCA